jgi:hypothetical protein
MTCVSIAKHFQILSLSSILRVVRILGEAGVLLADGLKIVDKEKLSFHVCWYFSVSY